MSMLLVLVLFLELELELLELLELLGLELLLAPVLSLCVQFFEGSIVALWFWGVREGAGQWVGRWSGSCWGVLWVQRSLCEEMEQGMP